LFSCVGAELSIIEVLSSNNKEVTIPPNSNSNQTEILILKTDQGVSSVDDDTSYDPRYLF
jgi:hypothetical protein